MSKGGTSSNTTRKTDPVEDQVVSDVNEAVPLPMLFGERKVAVKWTSVIYNQRSKEAPIETPGKK